VLTLNESNHSDLRLERKEVLPTLSNLRTVLNGIGFGSIAGQCAPNQKLKRPKREGWRGKLRPHSVNGGLCL
jgi:hypothetical protein